MTNEEPIILDRRKLDSNGAARDDNTRAAVPSDESDVTPESASTPSASAAEDAPGLAELKAENARLADELARAQAATYNVNQEYNAYVRRSKDNEAAALQRGIEKVGEALMGVLDDIALAREHDDLDGPFKSVAEKLENSVQLGFELTRFGAPGEEFDPVIHEALMDQPSSDVTEPTIAQVVQPGYRIGEKVLRPARVVVESPA